MRSWQSILFIGVAVIAGFSLGHQWSVVSEPSGKERRHSPALGAQPESIAIATDLGQYPGEHNSGAAKPGVVHTSSAFAAQPSEASGQARVDSDESDLTRASIPVPTSYERQQAFDEVSLLVSEQINSGQWYPEQQAAIHAAAQLLTFEQRDQLLSAFVGAMNRGELDPSMPLPPI